jgi:hypothetical protein
MDGMADILPCEELYQTPPGASAAGGSGGARVDPTSRCGPGEGANARRRIAMAPALCYYAAIKKLDCGPIAEDEMSVRLSVVVAAAAAAAALIGASVSEVASQAKPPLDYEAFKSRVEPIFLQKREGHVRCYTCHSEGNNALHLEKLPPGATFWTEEQSRKNFESVSGLVAAGDPASSRLLIHPLAPEAGGDLFHSGGRQFETKNDPDWKILAQWAGVK